MVFFNYALRKLNAKIVYYGPGLCGKTTNLQWVHDNFEGGDKGKMVSLATEGDRTIFFDLLPLDIGKIRGMDVTLQLYTVPGQVHYNSTRQLVLRGADGVVFVADSQRAMQGSNIDSLKNLDENLGLQGVNLAEFPHVIQFNKRDLGELMAIEEMDSALNRYDAPFFESCAVDGIGVQETLEGIVRLVMRSLKGRYEARGLGAEPSRLRPAGAPRTVPAPSVEPPPPEAAPTPPPAVHAVPPAPAEGAPAAAAFQAPPTFDIEQEPEAVSLEEPPPPVWEAPPTEQPQTVAPSAVAGVSDLPGEGPSPFDPPFEAPSVDVGPPDGDAAEDFDGLEPVPFEDIDTQTGMLIPPPGGEETEAAEAVPADLPPEGPGKPFETDEEAVGVAQYDTADVGDFPNPFEAEQEDALDSGPTELEDLADEVPEDVVPPMDLPSDEAPFSDEGMTQDLLAASPGHAVDDLVAAVLGESEEEGPPDSDIPDPVEEASDDAADQPEEMDVFEAPQESVPRTGDDVPDDDRGDVWAADSDVPAEPEIEPAAEVAEESPAIEISEPFSRPEEPTPVVFDDGDPFVEGAWGGPAVETPVSTGVLMTEEENTLPVSVSAENNSLALKLSGTGAIVESGDMRALDIEVPVPGGWVGNRKVTLQLRLTLLPVSEDENDGTNNPA